MIPTMIFAMRWTTRMEEEAAQAVPTAHTTMGVAAQAVPMDLIIAVDVVVHHVQRTVLTVQTEPLQTIRQMQMAL